MPIATLVRTRMMRLRLSGTSSLGIVFAAALSVASPCWAQEQQPPPPPPADQAAGPSSSPEIELNLVNLPTTLSLRRHRSYFRLTHRFARDLRRGDFGQLAEDLFSLDNGAIIGLEYRFGITSDLQAGVHRSLLSKTIQVFGRYDAWKQGDKLPGRQFPSSHRSRARTTCRKTSARHSWPPSRARSITGWCCTHRPASSATPTPPTSSRDTTITSCREWSTNTRITINTAFIGLGGRARIRPSVFIAGEYTPRIAGYDPGRGLWARRDRETVRKGAGTHCSSTSRIRSARHSGKSRGVATRTTSILDSTSPGSSDYKPAGG